MQKCVHVVLAQTRHLTANHFQYSLLFLSATAYQAHNSPPPPTHTKLSCSMVILNEYILLCIGFYMSCMRHLIRNIFLIQTIKHFSAPMKCLDALLYCDSIFSDNI